MKKVVFLIIAALLVIGLVLPGCAGGGGGGGGGEDTRPPITFAVAGPMTDVTGKHAWAAAEMAQTEINDGAGVNVGGVYHKIALAQVDTNEVSGTPEEGVAALKAVIDDVDFVLGGFRIDKVTVYREVAMDAEKIFMNCGAATEVLQYSVVEDYDRYKYWFKFTPLNDWFMVTSLFKMTKVFGQVLKQKLEDYGDAVAVDYRVPEDSKLRVAILMENVLWCAGMVAAAQYYLPALGYTVTSTTLVSPIAANITTEMNDIEALNPHIIFTAFSGLVGALYSNTKADLGIPAMTVGINVHGQQLIHWENTDGKCEGEVMLDTWAEGLENTSKTTAFFNAFVAKTGEYPIYTAATYDAIYFLKAAIEAVSTENGWDDIADVLTSANIDALIQYIETQPYTGTASKTAYYPIPAIDLGDGVYALSEAQVRELYDLDSYGWTYEQHEWLVNLAEAMEGAHIAHDIVYGPAYQTGIGSQWQDGKKVGVWPVDLGDDHNVALTDQYGCWNFQYPGTMDVVIPIDGFLAS